MSAVKKYAREDLVQLRDRIDVALVRLEEMIEDIEWLLELDDEGTSNCGYKGPHPQHRWLVGRETWVCPGREEGDM